MPTDADWARLTHAAREASAAAYCPYSHFAVGAAVLAGDGRVFAGCNVENASFGLTICAERNAIAQAVAAGAREIVAVCVFTPTKQPTPPCGACRQVIVEFGSAEVLAVCSADVTARWSAAELLPGAFGLAS